MKTSFYILLAILSILYFSMCDKLDKIVLSGKIALFPINSNQVNIYHLDKVHSFEISEKKNEYHYELSWLNTIDKFIVLKSTSTPNEFDKKNSQIYNKSISIVDFQNDTSKDILNLGSVTYLSSAFPSNNDQRLLFVSSEEGSNITNIGDKGHLPVWINIFDLKSDCMIKKIETGVPALYLDICESPWNYGEHKFTYAILDDNNVEISDKHNYKKAGIYIYDIENDINKLISKDGFHPIWSPDGHSIAYIKNNAIWIYDLNKATTDIIYQNRKFERITDIHWDPSSKYIYLVCPKVYFNSKLLMFYDEKLIDVKTRKILPFKKLNKGFCNYTWKG